MLNDIKLNGPAENALSSLQDTVLNPMEEALFQAWTKANKIDKPDAPGDVVDYRGIYKQTQGQILPNGQLKQVADKVNSETLLQRVLQERIQDRINKQTTSKEDAAKEKFKAERQDVTHKQKMQIESMKLKKAPHEVQMKKHDVAGKELDIEKAKVGNEGKQIDLIKSFAAPAPTTGSNSGGGNAAKTKT
jgi:hypothetical protein